MIVSAVIEPSVFEKDYFDELSMVNALDFLKGIERNGLLIIDDEGKLQNSFIDKIQSLSIKYSQQLQILIEELLIKKKSKRVIIYRTSNKSRSPSDLLELAYHLKKIIEPDALIVGHQGFEKLKSEKKFDKDIVLLSQYRDSEFEKKTPVV